MKLLLQIGVTLWLVFYYEYTVVSLLGGALIVLFIVKAFMEGMQA